MTNRVRFTTARQVVEAFPSAAEDIGEVAEDIAPLDHLDVLVADHESPAALLFAALMLPKREAVWWGCLTLRGVGDLPEAEQGGVAVADAWVRTPDERQRRDAGEYAETFEYDGPGATIAFAAFASGGSLTPAGLDPVPAPADTCGRMVYVAVLQATMHEDPLEQISRVRAAVASARDLATGGDGLSAWKDRKPVSAEEILGPDEDDIEDTEDAVHD